MNILSMFNSWWENIINLNMLDTEFEQELAILLLKYTKITNENNIDIVTLVKEISTFLRYPLTSPIPNFSNYITSIVTYDEWSELYDEFIKLLPIYNHDIISVYSMKDYLYKMYFSNEHPIDLYNTYIKRTI